MKAKPAPLNSPSGSAYNDAESQRAGIQSVEVGFSLLDVLANAGRALLLRDLAATAGMSAAKAHRYLVSFQRLGLVVQDAGTTRYDLGPAAIKLGLASLSRIDAIKLARARLSPLMTKIGQTLALAVWGNQGPCMVHWEESPQAVTVNLRLGDVMPLLSFSHGIMFCGVYGDPTKCSEHAVERAAEGRIGARAKAGPARFARQHGAGYRAV